MEQPIILSVRGQQFYENQPQPEVTELVTEGTWDQTEDGTITIRYEETELTGLEGTSTTFHITPGCVTLIRQGKLNSEMVFEYDRRHLSMYATPYGTIAIGVNTHKMSVDLDDDGGEVEIHYALEVDHAVMSENIFQLNVKAKQAQ